MPDPTPELLVVMPVFNESAAIARVVRGWFSRLAETAPDFVLLVLDDGSADATPEILAALRGELGPRLEIRRHANRGHGQTCLAGYREALDRGVPFILQIDSDGQSDPRFFPAFWEKRDGWDVIYGKRRRHDGLRRHLASNVLRILLRTLAKVDCVDANVPYRLMNSASCEAAIRSIPPDFFLANVALAVRLRQDPVIRHGAVPIDFPPRDGGEPSVPFSKFAAKAVELFSQLRAAGIAS